MHTLAALTNILDRLTEYYPPTWVAPLQFLHSWPRHRPLLPCPSQMWRRPVRPSCCLLPESSSNGQPTPRSP